MKDQIQIYGLTEMTEKECSETNGGFLLALLGYLLLGYIVGTLLSATAE